MLKIILIIFAIVYVFSKLASVLFKGVFNTMKDSTVPNSGADSFNPKEGNVNVNYRPQDKTQKKRDDFEGGEYVDFEEVK